MAKCKYYVNGVCTNEACGNYAELCPLPSVGAAFGDGVCCFEDVEPTMAEKEYIEREAALMALMNTGCLAHNLATIKDILAADVAKVRHGEWIKDASTSDVCAEYKCSLCGFMYCESDPKYPPYKYCPECGAKNE